MQDEPGALQQEQRNKMRRFSLIVFNLECIILSEDKGCVALIKNFPSRISERNSAYKLNLENKVKSVKPISIRYVTAGVCVRLVVWTTEC